MLTDKEMASLERVNQEPEKRIIEYKVTEEELTIRRNFFQARKSLITYITAFVLIIALYQDSRVILIKNTL